MPGIAEVLHKQWIALAGTWVAFLLDCDIASRPYNVGNVNEVVATEPVEGDFCLLAFMAVVKGDDGSRGFIGSMDF